MVKTEQHKGKEIFVCEDCDFGYADESTAEECEKACANKCCSLTITSKAVKK